MVSRNKYSSVSIIQSSKPWTKDIEYKDIRSMVRSAVEHAGGLNNLIMPGDVVVIKPNLVTSKDSTTGQLISKEANGITADWRIAKAVVELVREYNPTGKVYIMEGSAEYPTREVMKNLNYTKEFIEGVDEFIPIEEDSGLWQDYNSPRLVKVNLSKGLLHKEYYLNRTYKEADVLISLACVKSHGSAVVTGGIKNLSIGATPANIYGASETDNSRMNMVAHDNVQGDLHKWIHDYYICRPADFVILDGLQGFQNGPAPGYVNSSNEDLMNMRLIMAGRDAVAVDTIEALMMNLDPESVQYLKYISDSGYGIMDVSKIRVCGKQVDDVRKDFGLVKMPVTGARKISTKIAPRFTIKDMKINDNGLDIDLKVNGDAVKVEFYIDDVICSEDLSKNNKKGSSLFKGLSSGEHKLRVCVYDKYLNHSEETIPFSIP